MHEKAPTLTAQKRERIGTRYARRSREQGHLPAVVYGRNTEPLAVLLDARETLGHIHGGEKVFQLQLDGQSQTVLLRDVQFDYLGTRVIHCDLSRVSLSDRVHVKVPVRLVGEARGLKTAGAIMMHATSEVEIECIVTDIPDHIEADITELDVGHGITAADLKLPSPTARMLTDAHAMVAQIVVQIALEEKAEQATVEAEAGGQPEVIREKKKEEEPAAPGGKAPPRGGEKK